MGIAGTTTFHPLALLKALGCGDLLRVITLLFIIVNSTGVYRCNITSPALTQHCRGGGGELKMSLFRTLAQLSPAHPRRSGVGEQWLQMTGALHYVSNMQIHLN